MIEVENLLKKYGELVAIKGLSFNVEKGKIWGLLGPNAAGKTTTMRILTGYLPATDGRASVAGFDVFKEANALKKTIGYLPETLPLYPEMTVYSFLDFVAEIKQTPPSRRREALDPAQIIEIRKLIKSLKGERTILLSTHILAEMTQTCDGAVIINEGNLMASGSLAELTASFKEKEGVVIKLRQHGKETTSLLGKIPGVAKISQENDEFTIEWGKGKDLRDELTRLIVDKELGLIEMRPLAMNIEELYLKIISGGVEQ